MSPERRCSREDEYFKNTEDDVTRSRGSDAVARGTGVSVVHADAGGDDIQRFPRHFYRGRCRGRLLFVRLEKGAGGGRERALPLMMILPFHTRDDNDVITSSMHFPLISIPPLSTPQVVW